MLASEEQAEIGLRAGCPHGEEGSEVLDGEVLRNGDWECWEEGRRVSIWDS